MPELMALKLYHLVRRGLRTIPSITNPDRTKKNAYLARHKNNENWGASGVKTAGWMSKHVLWHKPTLKASIDDIDKRFKSLNVNMK